MKTIRKKPVALPDRKHTRDNCQHQDAYLMSLKRPNAGGMSSVVVLCRNCGARLEGLVDEPKTL